MLIDTNDERFWDILFNEANVEGWKAAQIEKELKEIAITELELIPKDILKELRQEIIQNYQSELKSFFESNQVVISDKFKIPLYFTEDNTWHDLLTDFLNKYKESLDTPLAQDIMKM